MKTGSKILLLTDFSEVADHAAFYTKLIASKINGRVEVMHVLQPPVDWIHLPKEHEDYYPETKKEIANAKSKLSELVHSFESFGIIATLTLLYSFGPENLFSHVQNTKADLVIMGSRGMGGSRSFMLGSNALKVLRNVKTPTLVIQKSSGKAEINKIAFMSTLEENQEETYSKIKEFAGLMGAEIDLVFINTPYNFFETEESDKMFNEFKQKAPLVNRVLINAHNTERGILFYSKNYHPDLLVLAKSRKPGLAKLFSSSLTENLVQEHDFPILSICIE